MLNRKINLLGVLILITPSTSYASGQEVIFLPIGQLIGLFIAFVLLSYFIENRLLKIFIISLSVLVVFLIWFVPRSWLPPLFGGSGLVDVLIHGAFPPIIITIVAVAFYFLNKKQ